MTDASDREPPEFEELRGILADFAAASLLSSTWVVVTEALLQFCRRHQPDAAAWESVHTDLAGSVVDGVSSATQAILVGGDVPSTNPQAGELDAVVAHLNEELTHEVVYDARFTSTLIARGIAGAIDAVYGDTFVDSFLARQQVEIRPDTAFPVSAHNPTDLLGGRKPNSRTVNLPSRTLDHTPRLALGKALSRTYPVMIDYSLHSRLGLLGAGSDFQIMVSQPNLSLAEFQIEASEHAQSIRNFGPADLDAQTTILKAHLDLAVQRRVGAVLIPEYCVAEPMRQGLADYLDEISDAPMIVVAGTSEVPDDSGGGVHNEAWVCVPSEPGSGSQKLFPAHLGDAVEGILPGAFVIVYPSRHFTFAVLICRDSMSADLLGTLADVGVNLLLVPSFSDRTGSIHGSSATLAARSQAFVAVGCAPAHWADAPPEGGERSGEDRKEASFIGPYEAHPGQLAVPDPAICGPVSGRGAWVFSTASRSVEWLPTQLPSIVDSS